MTQLGLTHQQARLLDAIKSYMAEHNGVGPSYEEIAAAIGIKSKSNIHYMLRSLRARGYVDFIAKHSRSIVVLDRSA